MLIRRAILFLLLITAVFSIPSLQAAPLFGDVPSNHWATDAVANLAAKGLIEGYPDGTFKGDRACTRWEMAMVIARFIAKNDQEHALFATKDELEALRKLTQEYIDELNAYGVRITAIEEETGKLNKRVTELERIRFYGSFESAVVMQSLGGNTPDIGSAAVPGTDWSNGRLLTSGSSISALARFGMETAINPEYAGGVEFAAFVGTGDSLIEQYWGVVPPYLSNPFLASGGNSQYAGIQPLNNIPWSRMTLDNFWLLHKPSETKVVGGSFRPEQADSFVLAGPRNPNIHQPEFLPFYGARVNSYKKDRLLSWEVSWAPLAQDSGTLSTYQSWMASGTVALNFDRARVSFNYLRALNEMNSYGSSQGSGIIALPASMSWKDTRTNTLRSYVGPQMQNTCGLGVTYRLSKEFDFDAELGQSEYNPDMSRTCFNTITTGSLFRAAIKGTFRERLRLSLAYLSISPTYDPFVLRYQTLPNMPVFLPYATYYSNYWQLHDSNSYPSNRQGFAFSGSYKWPSTELTVSYGSQEQSAASTLSQMQTPGNIEPIFPVLVGKGSEKGAITNGGVGLSHTFPCRLGATLGYNTYGISRPSSNVYDDVNFNQNVYTAGLTYPLTRDLNLYGNYSVITLKGHSGLSLQDFRQDIPSIGASYSLGDKSYISLSYRMFNLKNHAAANSDWNGQQTMMEYKVNF